jgi:hypothetical protein
MKIITTNIIVLLLSVGVFGQPTPLCIYINITDNGNLIEIDSVLKRSLEENIPRVIKSIDKKYTFILVERMKKYKFEN